MNEPSNERPDEVHPDEAFDRLRAADPADGVPEPRAEALHAKVDARRDALAREAGPDKTPDSTHDSTPENTDELAARRAPARRRRVLVAAAVAGAVVIGGGGYLAGALTGDALTGDGAGAASDAAVADAAGFAAPGAAQAPVAAPEAGDGAAPEAARGALAGSAADSSSAGAAADQAYPSYVGRTTFRSAGLSDQGGTGQAFAFDARGAATEQTAARAAAALGVPGDVRAEGDLSWAVGPTDGSGPSVWLTGDGTASLGYANPALDPWTCATPDAETGCPTPPATTVDDAAAATALADAMRALGVDPGQFEVTVEPRADAGDAVRWVTARRIVGGTLTQDAWSASVADGGLAGLYGSLADIVPLGEYPVVSPAEAVRRLSDPRFGDGGVMPLAVAERAAATSGPAAVPAPPSAGDPVAWPVADVTITGARLGLAQYWAPSGAVLFLPTYELSDDAGTTWTVLAVTDAALDFTTVTR